MRALTWIWIVLLAPACGSSVDPTSATPPERATIYLAPDATLLPAVERWADRWSEASGLDIVVSDAGVRVEMVAELLDEDGKDRAGSTTIERDYVRINYRAVDIEKAVGHELGHVLGGDHTDTDGVLSGHKGARPVIDEAALISVCRQGCPTFRPEAP